MDFSLIRESLPFGVLNSQLEFDKNANSTE